MKRQMHAQKKDNQKVLKQPTPPTARNRPPLAQHVYVSATLTDDVKTIANTYMTQREVHHAPSPVVRRSNPCTTPSVLIQTRL
jgi:superfamily II DNA/RNA helicase